MSEVIEKLRRLISRLRSVQDVFCESFGVADIYSNSKLFEILIADTLDHDLIPGHSGSRDANSLLSLIINTSSLVILPAYPINLNQALV